MARLHTLARLAPLAAVLAAAACDRAPTATPAPAAPPALAQELVCEATVASGQVVCRGTEPTATGGARAIILGGQGSYVRLTSTNAHYDGSAVFSVDVTVQNLIVQTLGTRDGTTADAEGVRVFIASGPTATGGTGVVSVANADGTDLFTASAQPYFQYPGLLRTDSTTAAKTWRFHAPSTVTTFSFRVYVSAAVARPGGWVEISPDLVDVALGGTRSLAATVRDVLGRPVPGAVTWASSDPAVATVDAEGVVSGHAPGSVVITATSGARTGTQVVGVVAGGDGTAPVVRSVSISPRAVDVTTADAAVEILIGAADGGAGVSGVAVLLSPPGGSSTASRGCSELARVSGTAASGVWRCVVRLPRSSAAGDWTLTWVLVEDPLHNARYVYPAELQAAGYPTTVSVTSGSADNVAPTVTSLSISPAAVDVTTADAAVEILIGAADAGAGVSGVAVLLSPPGGSSTASRGCSELTRVSGTAASGVWRCVVRLPRSSAAGDWTLTWVLVEDPLHNTRYVYPPELQAAGYPTTVSVTSGSADTVAPTVTGFTLSPAAVNVADADAAVEMLISALDAGGGVSGVAVLLSPPGGSSPASRGCSELARVSGTAADGVWRCVVRLPRSSVSGTWSVTWVLVEDPLHNSRYLYTAELQAAGYATTVQVSN